MFHLHTKNTLPVLLAVALFGLACVSSAQAAFGIKDMGVKVTAGDGTFSRQAGAHADITTRIAINTVDVGNGGLIGDGFLRDVVFDLPPGFVGDATIAPSCSFDLLLGSDGLIKCPVASQIGVAKITPAPAGELTPVYNLVRPSDAPALFGFNILGTVVTIEPRIRPDDFGVSADSVAISYALAPIAADVTLWGVPADPVHDAQRLETSQQFLGVASPDAPRAFLSNTTSCPEAPAIFTASIDSWQNPGAWFTKSIDRDSNATPFIFTGCEGVPFNPSVDLRPLSQAASAPLGFDVDLTVPQSDSPDGLASAHVRKTVVTFPKGVSVSPASAAGQGACTEAEIGLGSNAPPTCPDSSRLGTVKIQTPLLDEEFEGSLYLAEQGKNPFGSLLAAYVAVKGPGFYLKLPGKVEADPQDGQLTATFDDQPQLPYEKVSLSLRAGAGAPLVAPSACGTHVAKVEMTSWASSIPVTLDAPFTIDQNCDGGGFNPALKAGTTNPAAGAFSPFLLRLTRSDGEQNIARIDATLPEGLLAKLAGVSLCGDAAATTGVCPAASQIGTATVAVGAGPTPLYVPQPGKASTAIYLAGPYNGAPYSLVAKVPAQAGPFDLGTVAVRSAIAVDPVTTQVSVKSDPLPQILQGIPVAYRDIRVEVNRPDFMLNPTGCEPAKIASTIVSTEGASVNPSARFGVAGCRELGFKPKLTLNLKGGTRRGQHPALRAVLATRKGDANIARTVVVLPHSEFLAQNHIRTVCTRVQFAADQCPKASIYGKATARTPLLDQPLSGPVYLRSSSNPLPDLVAALQGQIDVDLVGRIDSKNGGIRTIFDAVPDAPVSKFVLTMQGGKKGLLENSRNLCSSTNRASVLMDGQNGKAYDSVPVLAKGCP
jgi:hypothetical protein